MSFEIKFYLDEDLQPNIIVKNNPKMKGLNLCRDGEGAFLLIDHLVFETPEVIGEFPVKKVVIRNTAALLSDLCEGVHQDELGSKAYISGSIDEYDNKIADIFVESDAYESAFLLYNNIRNGRWPEVVWRSPSGLNDDNSEGTTDMSDSSFGNIFDDDDEEDW